MLRKLWYQGPECPISFRFRFLDWTWYPPMLRVSDSFHLFLAMTSHLQRFYPQKKWTRKTPATVRLSNIRCGSSSGSEQFLWPKAFVGTSTEELGSSTGINMGSWWDRRARDEEPISQGSVCLSPDIYKIYKLVWDIMPIYLKYKSTEWKQCMQFLEYVICLSPFEKTQQQTSTNHRSLQ